MRSPLSRCDTPITSEPSVPEKKASDKRSATEATVQRSTVELVVFPSNPLCHVVLLV